MAWWFWYALGVATGPSWWFFTVFLPGGTLKYDVSWNWSWPRSLAGKRWHR